jgi:hypothetical protein
MSTFFSMMLFPHFVAGFLGMLGAILLTLRAWREPWTHGAHGAGDGGGISPTRSRRAASSSS